LIEADVPYANLSNRHYPTIAVYPNVLNFYTDRDSGGYFNFKGLGVLSYLSKDYVNTINPLLTANDSKMDQMIFRDPEVFVSNDIGLTNTTQIGPIINVSNNSLWMKGKITQGNKAGSIIGENNYKEFSPYQTKEETTGKSSNGLIGIDTDFDPWYSKFDNEWKDVVNWPPNFRKEYPIKQWNQSLNIFIDSQKNNRYDRRIKVSSPYICPDVQSKNIIFKSFSNIECLGVLGQNDLGVFNGVEIIPTNTHVLTSDGGIIIRVNKEFFKNNFLTFYTYENISESVPDFTNVMYGERVYTEDPSPYFSYAMLKIIVNGGDFYTPVYRTRQTTMTVSNLNGVFNFEGPFTLHGYMPLFVNEAEKRLIRLYTI